MTFVLFVPSCGKLKAHFKCKLDIRIREVGPVEDIEELRPQLGAHRLPDRNELHHRKIQVLLSWPIKKISRRVAERIVRIERRIVRRAEIPTTNYRS